MWYELRAKECSGLKFRRQVPFGWYILDFYRPECRLAVELDGTVHNDRTEYDQHRDDFLAAAGVLTLRFQNEDVYACPDYTLEKIRSTALARLPSPEMGEGPGVRPLKEGP